MKITPLEFEQLPPQPDAPAIVPCAARTGGVVCYYPRSMRYLREDLTLPWWFVFVRAWWWVQRRFRP